MFKALLGKQMGELLTFFIGGKKGKPRSTGQTVLAILLIIFVFGVLAMMFFGMSLSVCVLLSEAGLDWFYFTMMGGISLMLGIFGSIFTAYNGIFVAKDNELLLSMPIKSHMIVFVRMLSLYIIAFIFDAIALVPAGIVYFIFGSPTFMTFISYPITVIVLPMLALTVSCILGWIIALIVPHVKNKNIVTVAVSALFMGGYFVLCFGFGEYLEYIIANISGIAEIVKGNIYPLYLLGEAMRGEPLPFIGFLAISLLIFGAVYYAISKTFLKLSTAKRSAAKQKYQAKEMKVAGLEKALFRREFSKFISSSTYVLNCGMGVIMILLLSVFALVKGGSLAELMALLESEIPGISNIVPSAIALILSFMMSMVVISAPSVSLEGKTIWQIQSLPVRGRKVLQSKVLVHTAVLAPPAVICALILSIITKISPLAIISVLLYTVSVAFLGGYLGVVINLLMPKLEFTNETVAVKQSGSVLITMLILWAVEIVYTVLLIMTWAVIPSWITVLGITVINAIACFLMNYYISNGGEKKFATLS